MATNPSVNRMMVDPALASPPPMISQLEYESLFDCTGSAQSADTVVTQVDMPG